MHTSRGVEPAGRGHGPSPSRPDLLHITSPARPVARIDAEGPAERVRADGFAGSVSRRMAIEDMVLVETVSPRGSVSHGHVCHGPSLTLVVSGSYRSARTSTDDWTPPTVIFDPAPGAHVALFGGDGGACFSLELGQRALVELGRGGSEQPACYSEGGRVAWIMARMYREFRLMDDLSLVALQGLALHVIAAASRRMVEPERTAEAGWLHEVEAILREQFRAPPSLKRIAAVVGVHPVSLARAFRRRLGLSPGSYARLLRVEYASRQLASTDQAVSEIATAAGFANKSHLTRTFKLHSGMTPHAYRKLFRAQRR